MGRDEIMYGNVITIILVYKELTEFLGLQWRIYLTQFLCFNVLLKVRKESPMNLLSKDELLNTFVTGDTLLCGGVFEHAKHIVMHVVTSVNIV